MVGIPPTAQNIEASWEWKDIRVMLEEFGSFTRYLAFDKRGTGTSSRRSKIPGIDERVEDLKAVMDAAGFETAHLFACSEGGPMAIMFATGNVTDRKISTPNVRIETLGHFRVLVDGEEFSSSDWGSRHARQILKRLIAARGWPVTRDQLIDLCWPDESDMRRLSARLSVQLSLVRKVLGGGVIADRSSVRLDLNHVSVDLEQMLTAANDSQALELFQGDFLPDDVYEDWSVGVRDEARSHFFKSAESIIEVEQPGTRESIARRMIEVDRYDFRGHEILIEALQEMDQPRLADQARERWESISAEII